jgi:tRNA pseudouridine38-40 synthase
VSETVRYVARLAYLGTEFAGWQRQREGRTVQGVIEEALGRIYGCPIRVEGAGRTDAGVHAAGQVAHFDAPPRVPPAGLRALLGTTLPSDVTVLAMRLATARFDARRSARAKVYRYRLAWGAPLVPWEAARTLELASRPALDAMQRALGHVVGDRDFAAFARSGHSGTGPRGTVRRIVTARVLHRGRRAAVLIAGDGFLRGMVRRLVGAALEVGRGAAAERWFAALLSDPTTRPPAPTAPAHGLTLEHVLYRPGRR